MSAVMPSTVFGSSRRQTSSSDRAAKSAVAIEGTVTGPPQPFAEAGVLLAYGPGDEIVSLANEEVAERYRLHRTAVDSGERRLIELCEIEDLRLAVDQIHYFGHWVTPLGAPRRYDTRFFVAAAPPEQVPLHDDRETIANLWVRPADALAR